MHSAHLVLICSWESVNLHAVLRGSIRGQSRAEDVVTEQNNWSRQVRLLGAGLNRNFEVTFKRLVEQSCSMPSIHPRDLPATGLLQRPAQIPCEMTEG